MRRIAFGAAVRMVDKSRKIGHPRESDFEIAIRRKRKWKSIYQSILPIGN